MKWILRVPAICPRMLIMLAATATGACALSSGSPDARKTDTVRLYVFDCGTHHIPDPTGFGLDKSEVDTVDMAIACVLIAHPKGLLMWDVGAAPDSTWESAGIRVRVTPSDGRERQVTLRKPLLMQLGDLNYSPREITFLALSHYHFDHTANANEFAHATWLVRRAEREAMFANRSPVATQPSSYAALRNAKTVLIDGDYDVFGDGTVILKSTPGHTPGHQSLYVKLRNTGGVLLSGDLYHYRQSRSLQRVPKFDSNPEQSRTTRAMMEDFLQQTGTALWIQHDYLDNARLKKAPSYYD
jgi:glyoxylase-like metal-dependent hydrolase (beta-lactamase superfamily II)